MLKVLMTKQIPNIAYEKLTNKGISVDNPCKEGMSYEDMLSIVDQYDGLITMLADKVDEKLLAKTQKLKVISNFAVGYNNIDLSSAQKKGVTVTNTPDVLTEATAELALTLLMSCSRRINEAQNFIREGKWKRWETIKLLGPSLNGKTLGIYGMGRIGESFAKKCEAALGMKVIYHNRHQKDVPYSLVSFDELLKQSDVISIHSPLTDETRNIFNKEAFDKMKDSSILINTARGEICDTEDLYQALKSHNIMAAGLDVTSPEPLAPEHPIYTLENALITPHIGSATVEARDAMASLVADNIIGVLKGEGPVTEVKS